MFGLLVRSHAGLFVSFVGLFFFSSLQNVNKFFNAVAKYLS